MKKLVTVALTSLFCCFLQQVDAAYIFKNGKLIDSKDVAYLTVEEHYNLGIAAIKEKNWDEAIHQFRISTISFPESSYAMDSYYFLGVAYFYRNDLDLANQNLSNYLEKGKTSKYFLQAFKYKYAIAERFQNGEKAHLFHSEKLPQWRPASDVALKIYDEIINTLTNNELAAKALCAKGLLLSQDREYKEAIESFQTIIKRFQKSEMALNAYIMIGKTYLLQATDEPNNSDILGLAEVNVKKLGTDFPRAEEISVAKAYLTDMKELYAEGLFQTGKLYERKDQPKASVLYYFTALTQFPETKVAKLCSERLNELSPYVKEMQLPEVTETPHAS